MTPHSSSGSSTPSVPQKRVIFSYFTLLIHRRWYLEPTAMQTLYTYLHTKLLGIYTCRRRERERSSRKRKEAFVWCLTHSLSLRCGVWGDPSMALSLKICSSLRSQPLGCYYTMYICIYVSLCSRPTYHSIYGPQISAGILSENEKRRLFDSWLTTSSFGRKNIERWKSVGLVVNAVHGPSCYNLRYKMYIRISEAS